MVISGISINRVAFDTFMLHPLVRLFYDSIALINISCSFHVLILLTTALIKAICSSDPVSYIRYHPYLEAFTQRSTLNYFKCPHLY